MSFQGRAGRYPAIADHRGDVPTELDWTETHSSSAMAGADARAKAKNACRNRLGQQDGTGDLGHVDKEGGLPGSGTSDGRMTPK